MPLGSAHRTGLVEQVITQMRAAIADGEWPLGDRIPTEPELVNTLGVGRNTVREAVRALAHSGLLEVRQGAGTYVRATSELSGALRRLAGAELRESLEVRRMLEVEAARQAASRRTEDDIPALWAALHRRNALLHAKDDTTAVNADFELHELIVDCAHNALLSAIYGGITETLRSSVATTLRGPDAAAYQDDDIMHDDLVAAIVRGDAELAAKEAGAFLEHLLDQHGTQQPG